MMKILLSCSNNMSGNIFPDPSNFIRSQFSPTHSPINSTHAMIHTEVIKSDLQSATPSTNNGGKKSLKKVTVLLSLTV